MACGRGFRKADVGKNNGTLENGTCRNRTGEPDVILIKMLPLRLVRSVVDRLDDVDMRLDRNRKTDC